ncbi:hypothetical protein D3C71_1724120 [compost metagenome]
MGNRPGNRYQQQAGQQTEQNVHPVDGALFFAGNILAMHDVAAHAHILQDHRHREDSIDNRQDTQFMRFQLACQHPQLYDL